MGAGPFSNRLLLKERDWLKMLRTIAMQEFSATPFHLGNFSDMVQGVFDYYLNGNREVLGEDLRIHAIRILDILEKNFADDAQDLIQRLQQVILLLYGEEILEEYQGYKESGDVHWQRIFLKEIHRVKDRTNQLAIPSEECVSLFFPCYCRLA